MFRILFTQQLMYTFFYFLLILLLQLLFLLSWEGFFHQLQRIFIYAGIHLFLHILICFLILLNHFPIHHKIMVMKLLHDVLKNPQTLLISIEADSMQSISMFAIGMFNLCEIVAKSIGIVVLIEGKQLFLHMMEAFHPLF